MRHKIFIRAEKPKAGRGAGRLIKRAVLAALKAEGVAVPCRVDVLLTDDMRIREINRAQRNVDAPTDVLSFPFNELRPGQFDPGLCETDPRSGRVLLGDMVLSVERCRAQALEYGHGFARELSYLTAHSVLHLLGYDHLDEGEQKKKMRAREDAVMEVLGM